MNVKICIKELWNKQGSSCNIVLIKLLDKKAHQIGSRVLSNDKETFQMDGKAGNQFMHINGHQPKLSVWK